MQFWPELCNFHMQQDCYIEQSSVHPDNYRPAADFCYPDHMTERKELGLAASYLVLDNHTVVEAAENRRYFFGLLNHFLKHI